MADSGAHAGWTADSEGVAGGVHVRAWVCDPGEKPAALRDAGAVFCGRGVMHDVRYGGRFSGEENLPMFLLIRYS